MRIEKTAFPQQFAEHFGQSLQDLQVIESNDIYSWFFGQLTSGQDVKINMIFPATEVHIRKYSKQDIFMIHETPELYEKVVKPYIAAFPPSRTKWVDEIVSGKQEAEKVLHRDDSGVLGYMIIPDMKWDLKTVSSLYLLALATSDGVKSLRDLRRMHVPVLKSIRKEATRVVKESWGLEEGSLRFFVHYQPSYYHFHVHIVHASLSMGLGMLVGQAHLLDDVIALLEIDLDGGAQIFEKLTLTYGLGEQHGLFDGLKASIEGHNAHVTL